MCIKFQTSCRSRSLGQSIPIFDHFKFLNRSDLDPIPRPFDQDLDPYLDPNFDPTNCHWNGISILISIPISIPIPIFFILFVISVPLETLPLAVSKIWHHFHYKNFLRYLLFVLWTFSKNCSKALKMATENFCTLFPEPFCTPWSLCVPYKWDLAQMWSERTEIRIKWKPSMSSSRIKKRTPIDGLSRLCSNAFKILMSFSENF